jgi:hypothetical protein
MVDTTTTLIFGAVCLFLVAGFLLLRRNKNPYLASPRISWKAKVINLLLLPWHMAQYKVFRPITLEGVMKQGAKKARSSDFGDDGFMVPYRYAIERFSRARFSPIGHLGASSYLMRRMIARLRLNEYLKAKPAIQNVNIRAPVFVMGLPRTGTTFLHRLLSMDPEARAPLTWELFDTVPRCPEDPVKDAKSRRNFVAKAIEKIDMIAPILQTIHEVGADEPEECLVAMGIDIPIFFCTFHLLVAPPTECYDWDLTGAYANYKKQLQVLQETGNSHNKRWTLKCPVHLGFLQHLGAVFPDAKIVWTHRDPCNAVASLASFIRVLQEVHEGGQIDLQQLGQNVMNYGEFSMRSADEQLEKLDLDHCHVQYDDIISDPVETVKGIYSQLGFEYTDAYDTKIRAYIEENRKKRASLQKGNKKLHKYNMEDYGVTDAEIQKRFHWYSEKYSKKQN